MYIDIERETQSDVVSEKVSHLSFYHLSVPSPSSRRLNPYEYWYWRALLLAMLIGSCGWSTRVVTAWGVINHDWRLCLKQPLASQVQLSHNPPNPEDFTMWRIESIHKRDWFQPQLLDTQPHGQLWGDGLFVFATLWSRTVRLSKWLTLLLAALSLASRNIPLVKCHAWILRIIISRSLFMNAPIPIEVRHSW